MRDIAGDFSRCRAQYDAGVTESGANPDASAAANGPAHAGAALRIVSVPPPRARLSAGGILYTGYMWAYLAFMALIVRGWALAFFGGAMIATVPIVVFVLRRNWRFKRDRERWLAEHPEWFRDPVADELAREWRFLDRAPGPRAVRAAVAALAPESAAARVVAYMGLREMPQPADYRLEPEILSPTECTQESFSVPQAITATVLGILLVFSLIVLSDRVPALQRDLLALMWGAAIGMGLFYAFVLRPRYVRIAPGVVETVTYGYFRRKPQIRRFTLGDLPLCIVVDTPLACRLTLWRSERDVLIVRLRRRGEFRERLLRALLSTAPTRPLSGEDLLG